MTSDQPIHKKQSDEFFSSLGYAINRWSIIDRALFKLFRFALNAKNDTIAAIVFYKFSTVSEHFAITELLMKVTLPRARMKEWKAIYAEAIRLTPIRNRLAHDPCTQVVAARGTASTSTSTPPKLMIRIFQISPSWELHLEQSKLLKQSHSEKPPNITLKAIEKHITEVVALEGAMQKLLFKLPARARKPLSEPTQPQPRLKSPQKKKRPLQKSKRPQTPAKQKPQPQSSQE